MIRNLLFDLGGVIMDIKRENCIEAFRRLGMDSPERFLGEYVQAGPFRFIEDGSMDKQQFRDEMRRYLPAGTSDSDIDKAFSDFLVGIPLHRLRELEKLHRHYKIYLLSNTNPIMWDGRIADEFRKDGHDVNFYFDGIVKSYEAKCMKPDSRIFDYTIGKLGIRPDETLFFDDSQANLDSAAKAGFRTALIAPGSEFYSILSNMPDTPRLD